MRGPSSRREFEDELVFDGYKKQGASSAIDLSNGSRNEATVVDLEIDLMEMILHDPFLGENFIKCLFRYNSHLNQYVKEVFLEMYSANVLGESQSPAMRSKLEEHLWLNINLRLSHFPTSVNRIDPQALLSNNLLQNHGQLVKIKFARVISVFPPATYILRVLKERVCNCHMSPKEINEVNNNPLKIFKNFVNYVGPAGKSVKSLHYNVIGDNQGYQGNDHKFMETYC